MKKDLSIKLRAAFLLIVFALNTMVAFACSIGVDMGYNRISNGTEATVHIHKDGKKHVHGEKKSSHHHKCNSKDQTKKGKDNCCTDKVRTFEQLDKSVRHPFTFIHPVFFTTFIAAYYDLKISSTSDFVKDIKPFVRSYHPPIANIRIAIQSFLI
jgi:hypothetical protein